MKVFIFLSLIFNLALSAGFDLGEIHQKPINIIAVSMFLIFVLATLQPYSLPIILIKNPNPKVDFILQEETLQVCKMVWL